MVEERLRYAIRFLSRHSKDFSLKEWRQINNPNYTKLLTLPKKKKIIIPPSMIPYSKRDRSKNFSECVVFYEHDINFADIVRNTKDFVEDLL